MVRRRRARRCARCWRIGPLRARQVAAARAVLALPGTSRGERAVRRSRGSEHRRDRGPDNHVSTVISSKKTARTLDTPRARTPQLSAILSILGSCSLPIWHCPKECQVRCQVEVPSHGDQSRSDSSQASQGVGSRFFTHPQTAPLSCPLFIPSSARGSYTARRRSTTLLRTARRK